MWGSGEGVKEGRNVINVFGEGSGINRDINQVYRIIIIIIFIIVIIIITVIFNQQL